MNNDKMLDKFEESIRAIGSYLNILMIWPSFGAIWALIGILYFMSLPLSPLTFIATFASTIFFLLASHAALDMYRLAALFREIDIDKMKEEMLVLIENEQSETSIDKESEDE